MNREILFRGKDSFGLWAYGFYVEQIEDAGGVRSGILKNGGNIAEVDIATIGQFTGLTDKNGRKIFEGDIISHKEMVYEVKYSTEQARFLALLPNGVFNPVAFQNCEVVDNIHDNPELFEMEE